MRTQNDYEKQWQNWCKKDDATRGNINKVKIVQSNYGFEVYTPYNQHYINRIKQIPGRSWNKDKKCWFFGAEYLS